MTINGVLVNMELDTGAAVSVMSTTQFRQLFPSAVLEPTRVKLRTYTGALVQPQGLSLVNVQHGDYSASLPLYVVDHKGPPLLGREWLHAVQLEWTKIWNLNNVTRGSFTCRRHKDQLLARTTDPDRGDADQEGDEFLASQPSADPVTPSILATSGPAASQEIQTAGARRYPTRDRRPPDRYQAGV
ncbi:uncharacterized protein LOC144178135 isoform X3 [Haemaphysalis longicornis]